jgi:hypothetical protein
MTSTNASSLTLHRSPDERTAAAIAHAGTCVAWFVAPLVVYLVSRERSPWVARQALAALLWSGLGTVAGALTCGLAIPLFLVVHVWAALVVLRGDEMEYPIVSGWARHLTT